jgi:hypothetical protein
VTDSEALYDDLAGVVDLFGALSRAELERALDELAFKQGRDADAEALAAAVDGAVENYYLVAAEEAPDGDGAELLVPGPVAFPTLPPNAEDLPHILDVPDRSPDRARLAEAVVERLREDVADAADQGDDDRLHRLLDVTYDVEAWTSTETDVGEVRARLDDALDE